MTAPIEPDPWSLAAGWRREVLLGWLASVWFAVPSLIGQVGLGRMLGKAQDLAALLSLGSASRAHLWLLPADAVVSGALRLAALVALTQLLLLVLVGRTPWRGTAAVVGRGLRTLGWFPALVVGVGTGVFLGHTRAGWFADLARHEQLYLAMKAWLGLQGLVWFGACARISDGLAREHRLGTKEAWLVGMAPFWAGLAVVGLDAALP